MYSVYLDIHIGGLGELVRLVRPPVTGRSASFRLRFRFVRAVRAVRAGEAKLRGCACADRCPYRWASWELGSTFPRLSAVIFFAQARGRVFLSFSQIPCGLIGGKLKSALGVPGALDFLISLVPAACHRRHSPSVSMVLFRKLGWPH